ncbi:discoidin domain-containing protein, partial [Planctomycetota bacterium]
MSPIIQLVPHLLATLLAFAGTDTPRAARSLHPLEQRLTEIDSELEQLADYSLRTGVGTVGFRSMWHPDPNHTEWIRIDWGHTVPIDQIVLVPTIWRDTKAGFRADGFPLEFKLITGTDPSETGTVVASFCKQDRLLPRLAPLVISITSTEASWLRIEATTLSPRAWDGKYLLQLSEVLVFNGSENVALHQALTVSSPGLGETRARIPQTLVDGFVPYL